MSWYWAAGYMHDRTQAEVSEAIRTTLETRSRGRVKLAGDTAYQTAVISASVLPSVVSTRQDDWVAMWNKSGHFCGRIFKMHGFSGITISGFDELFDDPEYGWWEYVIWDKGEMEDWFSSNPKYQFQEWTPRSLEKDVMPYLKKMGRINREEDLSDLKMRRQVEEHLDVFSGKTGLLMQFAKPSVDANQLSSLLRMPQIPALYELPEILDIPFVGPDYNIKDMVVFLDIERGVLTSPQDLHYLDLNAEDPFTRSTSWTRQVSKFRPLLFELSPGVDHSIINQDDEIADLFFAQL